MGQAKLKPATYADVLAAPEHMVAEVVGGELHLSPRPGKPHLRAASRLGAALDGPFDHGRGGPGGWVILDEPELHLGGEPAILVPDIAGWKRARLPVLFDDVVYFTLAPDWVCEVLSPKTAKYDRTVKMPAYAREGVAYAWLVDPLDRTLEVYRNQDGKWLLLATHADDEKVRAEPFDALELDLADLWS
jgi:Uma2 family endonuclease